MARGDAVRSIIEKSGVCLSLQDIIEETAGQEGAWGPDAVRSIILKESGVCLSLQDVIEESAELVQCKKVPGGLMPSFPSLKAHLRGACIHAGHRRGECGAGAGQEGTWGTDAVHEKST